MSKDELQKMYDEILACYSSFGVNVTGASAEDEPVIEGPASILFKVRPGAGVDPRKVYEKAEALKLKLRLESDQNVGFDNDRGYVTIDVPKSENQRYFVDAEELWARWTRPEFSLSTPLGEDRFGETVEIDFSSSNSPHLLIGGTTGSGKSEALNTILYGLATHYSCDELQFLLVDPKGTELSNFEHSLHLRGEIGIYDDDAIAMLKEAVIEMKNRYEKFRAVRVRSIAEYNKQSATTERLPWWIIVLDEYGDLTSDNQKKKEIEQELKRLAQMARACGIHVIIATQKPSAEVISTNLRSNLPAQLALRVKSGIESRVIMDDMGAETLNGKGDAFIKAEGKLRRVQCARVRNPEPLRP
jgi:DNA phosphorothioation-dependent restriction protein DptH